MTRLELLEECGVHPPDLNRVLAALGIAAHAASVDEAEALIRRALPHLGASTHSSERAAGHFAAGRSDRQRCASAGRGARAQVQLPGRAAGARFDRSADRAGRVRRDHRPERLGQDHARQASGRPAASHRGRRDAQRARPHARCARPRPRPRSATSSRTPTIRSSPRPSRTRSPSGRATSTSRPARFNADATRSCARWGLAGCACARSLPAQQGRAPAPGGGERARAAPAPADPRRADHRSRLPRAAPHDGAGDRAQPRRNRDRDDHAYAVAGRRVRAPRGADARRAQALRRRRARILRRATSCSPPRRFVRPRRPSFRAASARSRLGPTNSPRGCEAQS